MGLEISGLAVVDLEADTALHLESIQTPGKAELKSTEHFAFQWQTLRRRSQ